MDKSTSKKTKKNIIKSSSSSVNRSSSMEAQMLKERLQTLTGSEHIRVNDPDYRKKLRKKVWQEYEIQQDKEEKEREERERERMRRLVSRGIIGAEELRNDRILSREYRLQNDLQNNKRKKNRKRPETRKPSPQRIKSAPAQTLQQNRVSFGNDEKLNPPSTRRPKTSVPGQRERGSSTSYPAAVKDTPQPLCDTRPESSVSRMSRTSTRSRYEHPIIQQMRQEERLDELYRLAEEIIPEPRKDKDLRREMTQEELALEEENKYKGKKIKAKIRF